MPVYEPCGHVGRNAIPTVCFCPPFVSHPSAFLRSLDAACVASPGCSHWSFTAGSTECLLMNSDVTPMSDPFFVFTTGSAYASAALVPISPPPHPPPPPPPPLQCLGWSGVSWSGSSLPRRGFSGGASGCCQGECTWGRMSCLIIAASFPPTCTFSPVVPTHQSTHQIPNTGPPARLPDCLPLNACRVQQSARMQ